MPNTIINHGVTSHTHGIHAVQRVVNTFWFTVIPTLLATVSLTSLMVDVFSLDKFPFMNS